MNEEFTKFEVSEFLDNDEIISEYLNLVLEENDSQALINALGEIAKAKGIKSIAELAGVGRESLYKSLSSGSKPRFETISKIIKAFNLTFKIEPVVLQNTYPVILQSIESYNEVFHKTEVFVESSEYFQLNSKNNKKIVLSFLDEEICKCPNIYSAQL